MLEKNPSTAIFSLAPELTEMIIRQPMTNDLAHQIEKATNAYFRFEPGTFGGILHHAPGKGPENPYFRPISDNDWLPEVQGISRIGVQYYYWNFLLNGLAKKDCNPVKIYSLVIWPLYPNPDNSALTELDSHPNRLKQAAKLSDDPSPRFPAYIPLVNYGGDADFYGTFKNQIFPMEVKTKGGDIIYIDRTQLGLSEEIVEESWQSWLGFSSVYGQLFHQGIIELCNQELFPSKIAQQLISLAKKGNKFLFRSAVVRDLVYHGEVNNEKLIDTVISVMDTNSKIIFKQEKLQRLILATQKHVANLKRMYDTARFFRSDIFDYE